jgi:hypothetical protein
MEVKTSYQNVIDLREQTEETCKLASEKLAESAIVSKTYYDKTAKWRYFKPGDKVLLLLTNSSNKLQLSWKGPFEVVEKVNQFDYKIQMKGKIRTFHANMLKKYEERDDEFKLDRLRGKTAPDKIETCAGLAVIDEEILLREGNDDVELPVCETQQTEDYSNVNIDKDLDENKRKELEQLIFEFQDIFTDIPGKTNLIEVELKLQRDEEIKLKPFPIPLNLRDKLNEEIDAMIKLDIIEPSTARYASPLVMIKKADGVSYRICTDYRVLNKLLINQQEPINNVEELWSNIHGSKFYSKMDLTKGFWQLPIKEESRDITSFVSPRGLFRYKFLPFGLSVSPAWFTKMMRLLLDGTKKVEHFFDDILAHAETWSEHIQTLREIFMRVRKTNLTLKPSKCYFGNTSIDFLGHNMSNEGLTLAKDKIRQINSMMPPKDKKSLLSFLGCLGYHRKFIPNYSSIAKPLTDMTQKKVNFKWGEAQQNAFETLKDCLNKEPFYNGLM